MRVLALHGKSQNKEIFRTRLGQLPKKLKKYDIKFEIVEAPHDLPVEDDSVPTKTWFNRVEFRSIEPETLETTLQLIEAEWLQALEEEDPFVGLLGFSQGGTLAAILATQPDRFPGLRFAVIIGAPNNDIIEAEKIPKHVKSLHCAGETDAVVPVASSTSLANKFHDPSFYLHPQGHCIPSRAESQRTIVDYFASMVTELSMSSIETADPKKETNDEKKETIMTESALEGQRDEIEAVVGIYGDENVSILSLPEKVGDETGCFTVILASPDISPTLDRQITVKFKLPSNYPEGFDSPQITVDTGLLSLQDFSTKMRANLIKTLTSTAAEHVSMQAQCTFACVQAAIDWLCAPIANKDEDLSCSPDAEASSSAEECSDAWYTRALDPVELSEEEEKEEMIMMEIATSRAAAEQTRRNSEQQKDGAHDTQGVYPGQASHKFGTRKEVDGEVGGTSKGVWRYCIGLVGKPSAGKSTFYNCATQACLRREGRLEAAMASQPFTTIDPNIGEGYFLGPSDAEVFGSTFTSTDYHLIVGTDSDADNKVTTNRRLLPVRIKDVAGLVPGAYKGRGKGNKFLNDLTDADCLVHVVDISGLSDEAGNMQTPYEGHTGDVNGDSIFDGNKGADKDAKWVRQEIHRWIFHNIKAKWHTVVRHTQASGSTNKVGAPDKALTRAISLFTGYHATPAVIRNSILDAGLDLGKVVTFSEQDVHCLVAHFLQRRFPICLALNKIDLVPTHKLVSHVQERRAAANSRGELAVPVCAKLEYGRMKQVAKKTAQMMDKEQSDMERLEAVFHPESMGVLACLTSAVSMRSPIYVYPVSDLDSLAPIGSRARDSTASAARLQDCLLVKPGSTVGDVFAALKAGACAHTRLSGELVRCSAMAHLSDSEKDTSQLQSARKVVQLGRDSQLNENTILHIQTNRKSVWQ